MLRPYFAPNSSVEPISSSTVSPLNPSVIDYNDTTHCDMNGLFPHPRRTLERPVFADDSMGPNPINPSETGGPEVSTQVVWPDSDILKMLQQLSHFQDLRAANKSKSDSHCRSSLSNYMIGVYLLLGILALLVSSSIFSLSISRFVRNDRI